VAEQPAGVIVPVLSHPHDRRRADCQGAHTLAVAPKIVICAVPMIEPGYDNRELWRDLERPRPLMPRQKSRHCLALRTVPAARVPRKQGKRSNAENLTDSARRLTLARKIATIALIVWKRPRPNATKKSVPPTD
jgi:hypothetical protein